MSFGAALAQSPETEMYQFKQESHLLSPDSIDCGVLVKTIVNRAWEKFLSNRRRMVKCVAKAVAAGREVRTTFVDFGVDTQDGETTIVLKDQSAIVLRFWYEGEDAGNRPFSVAKCPDVALVRKEPSGLFDLGAHDKVLVGVGCVQDDSLGERVYPKKIEGEIPPNTSLEQSSSRHPAQPLGR